MVHYESLQSLYLGMDLWLVTLPNVLLILIACSLLKSSTVRVIWCFTCTSFFKKKKKRKEQNENEFRTTDFIVAINMLTSLAFNFQIITEWKDIHEWRCISSLSCQREWSKETIFCMVPRVDPKNHWCFLLSYRWLLAFTFALELILLTLNDIGFPAAQIWCTMNIKTMYSVNEDFKLCCWNVWLFILNIEDVFEIFESDASDSLNKCLLSLRLNKTKYKSSFCAKLIIKEINF